MRSLRFSVLVPFLLLAAPAWSQQNPTATVPTAATKDPQAVIVLSQALTVAGGPTAIAGIAGYTATGTITYRWTQDVQGTVTVEGLAPDDLRIDASLPIGVRSEATHNGQLTVKNTEGAISRYPPASTVPSNQAIPYKTPMVPAGLGIPYFQIIQILGDPRMTLHYEGLVQLDGHSVYRIEAQRHVSSVVADDMAEYRIWDFFIDASSSQLLMVRDVVPLHTVHEVRYSEFQTVNGVLVPFSVSEQMGGQRTWDMHISQISFNSGLQDSNFVIQ